MNPTDIRIGNGYDVHPLAEGYRFVLGGVEVPHRKGCPAHSDGDVAIHALCDALLGALALGDIGKHFPDSSPLYKGIDSRILLTRTVGMIHEKGYAVGNVDLTIALQKPKIGGLIPVMRRTLSTILDISEDRMSIKATTTEKLGFVGREEGVEAYASALIYKS